MAVYPLQSSNVFSYTFAAQGNTHTHYLVAGNNNPVLNIGGQSWTVECWLKPAGTGNYANYYSIFSKRRGTGATKGTDISYLGYLDTTNGFVGYYDGSSTVASTRLTSNAWSHVAWVFNQGSNVRIFVNGTNVATNSAITSVANIDSQFFIGLNPGQNSQYFGDISNFRIVLGQALYSGESFNVSTYPMQLPNNSIGPHVGTGNVAASLTGNVVLLTCNDQIIKSNGNVRINGTSTNSDISVNGFVYPHAVDTNEVQHYSFANFDITSNTANSAQTSGSFMLTTDSANLNIPSGNFTIECWAYLTTNTAAISGGGDIVQRGGAINIAWPSFCISCYKGNVYFGGSNTNARLDIGGDSFNGVGGNVERGFIGTIQPNVWNHIAVVRTGTTYNGFLNGVLGYTETTANTPYNSTGRGLVMMGGFENASNVWTAGGVSNKSFNGYVTDVRITKAALYPANTNFTPPKTPLQLLPNTAFLLKSSGSLPIDATGNVTISSNGTGILYFTTVNPYTSNAIANANATTAFTRNRELGQDEGRIYDKFDYVNFGQMVNIYAALGQDESRIYDKFDSGSFASTPVNPASAVGQDAGRIYDKFDSGSFAAPPRSEAFTSGQDQGRIYDKFDYRNFGQMVNIYPALGQDEGRIYSKFNFGNGVGVTRLVMHTIGRTEGRIYSKQNMGGGFAYIPVGGAGGAGTGTANIEYEFWS